ncbi:hypothetical protein [Bartonella vinsonii]|nr:hypothetical protein [Bartonella vinsonii]
MLADANEQFERKKREGKIYKKILTKLEESLFEETRKIPREWINKWDQEIKQWEDNVLKIKCSREFVSASEQRHPMIKDICAQGYADTFFLYERVLKAELTAEHIERFNELMRRPIFKKTYRKVVRLMKRNGIIVEKFIDPFTKKKRHKPTMLLLHWWLYMVDDMIMALYEQQQKDKASGRYKELAAMEIYWSDISKNTEYDEILKILKFWYHLLPDYEALLYCKIGLLELLYDVSSDYKRARGIFIYYKRLIETVKEGYVFFNKGCTISTVVTAINECKKRDKEKKEGLRIAKETPTFEEAYKLGVKEWMKGANKICDNRLFFWEMLMRIDLSREDLKLIFGDEKVEALEKAIKKEQEQFKTEMQEAILGNQEFHYNKSYAHLIEYLQ